MHITRPLTAHGATDGAITELEQDMGARFPNDYRKFLTTHNGGAPTPSIFRFKTVTGESDASIRYFLSVSSTDTTYNIREFLRRYEDRLPDGFLPIACDSFGNLVLLGLRSDVYGQVVFWDHECENDDDGSCISVVASSFDSFVDMLT